MDNTVVVRRSFLNELRGLLVAFRAPCETCYRASCDCILCEEMRRAKVYISMLDNIRDAKEELFYVENPLEDFLRRIETAISQGNGTPVKSSEIKVNGANRQRKARALKVLLKRRRIRKITTDGEPVYVINEDGIKTKTQNTEKGERHGV